MSGAAADPFPPDVSPDGRIEVRYDATEVRMSIWLRSPTVVRTRDGKRVATYDFPWSCDRVEFPQPDRVVLHLRRFPDGERTTEVEVDVERPDWRGGTGPPV